MTKYQAAMKEFDDARNRLEDVLREEKTEFIRDAAIKRFELVFDLAWKTIKAFLKEQGVSCASPMGCFREAYRQGILEYEDFWIEMVNIRNKTTHTYAAKLAEEVYAELPQTLIAFEKLAESLRGIEDLKSGK